MGMMGALNSLYGTMNVTNSTISGNIGLAIDAGIYATTTIVSCTISGGFDANLRMGNSILAGTKSMCRSIDSLDCNLIQSTANLVIYGLTNHNIGNFPPWPSFPGLGWILASIAIPVRCHTRQSQKGNATQPRSYGLESLFAFYW